MTEGIEMYAQDLTFRQLHHRISIPLGIDRVALRLTSFSVRAYDGTVRVAVTGIADGGPARPVRYGLSSMARVFVLEDQS